MQIKNIIQTVINAIKITSLRKGDVVKILDKTYPDIQVKYGVVLDLLNDGEKTFIQMLQYKIGYSDVEAEIKIYEGLQNLSIFPINKEEVIEYFKDTIKKMDIEIEIAKKDLQKSIEANEKAKLFVSGELSKTLSEVEFKTQTQEEYNLAKVKKQRLLNN